jgi:hypothetical protein
MAKPPTVTLTFTCDEIDDLFLGACGSVLRWERNIRECIKEDCHQQARENRAVQDRYKALRERFGGAQDYLNDPRLYASGESKDEVSRDSEALAEEAAERNYELGG